MTRRGSSVRKIAVAALLATAVAVSAAEAATIFVNADITTSETWTADNEYILTDRIQVTSGATLTIEPGVVVRGESEDSPGAQNPGTLIITRGSKIRALGNKLHPITFTDPGLRGQLPNCAPEGFGGHPFMASKRG